MSSDNWHRFQITNEKPIGRGMKILMDGIELQGVTFVSFEAGVDVANKIRLEMYAKSINADVVAEPTDETVLDPSQAKS